MGRHIKKPPPNQNPPGKRRRAKVIPLPASMESDCHYPSMRFIVDAVDEASKGFRNLAEAAEAAAPPGLSQEEIEHGARIVPKHNGI